MPACCADPHTEPRLKDLADAVGAETAIRMNRRVFIPIPLEESVEVDDLCDRLKRVSDGLGYHIPE